MSIEDVERWQSQEAKTIESHEQIQAIMQRYKLSPARRAELTANLWKQMLLAEVALLGAWVSADNEEARTVLNTAAASVPHPFRTEWNESRVKHARKPARSVADLKGKKHGSEVP